MIESEIKIPDREDRFLDSRSRSKSKNRNSSEGGEELVKQLRILVNPNHIIRIRPLEETWNLLDPLSVGKRVVLFNFRVSLSLSLYPEYEILRP